MKEVYRNIFVCKELNESELPQTREECMQYMKEEYERRNFPPVLFFTFIEEYDGVDCIDIYAWSDLLEEGVVRFPVIKDTCFSIEKEQLFDTLCGNKTAEFDNISIRLILDMIRDKFPDINMDFYDYIGQIIAHMYYTLHSSGPKEVLYKANLGYLGMHVEKINHNLIGTTPSEIFDDIPLEMLQILDSELGVEILNNAVERPVVSAIYHKFGSYIKSVGLNEYQWDYLLDLYMNQKECVGIQYRLLGKISEYSTYLMYKEYLKYEEAVKDYFEYEPVVETSEPAQNLLSLKELYHCVTLNRVNYEARIKRTYNRDISFFGYEDEKYFITMPQDIRDFCEESKILKYPFWLQIRDIAYDGKRLLLMRSVEKPEEPLVAILVDSGNYINHSYGKYSGKPTEEQQEWIEQYAQIKGLHFGYKRLHWLAKHGYPGVCNCCKNILNDKKE